MPSSKEAAHPQPVRRRLVGLDALRGVALFGILVVNLPFQALDFERVLDLHDGSSVNRIFAGWTTMMFESNFVALFSLLFGAGLILQWRNIEEAGEGQFKRTYLKRLSWLGLAGLVHGVLLFEGDILLTYALFALPLLMARRWSARRLAWVSLLPLGIAVLGNALIASFPEGDPGSAAEASYAHLEASLPEFIVWRTESFFAWSFVFAMLAFNWRVLACFFLGAALCKNGFFEERGEKMQRAMVRWALPLGLVGEGAALWISHQSTSLGPLPAAAGGALHTVASLILALGYAGVVLRFAAGSRENSSPIRALAGTGRCALTVYLAQSLIGTWIFTHFGLGLYGSLDRAQIFGLAVLIFLVQVVLAQLWLARYTMGPFEWLWRAATYGRLPKLRRNESHG